MGFQDISLYNTMNTRNYELYNRRKITPTPITPTVNNETISTLKSRIGTLEKQINEMRTGWECPKCKLVHSPYKDYCVCHTDLKLL